MSDGVARRLALLEGIALAPDEREAVAAELAEYERALALLEPFAEGCPWPAGQVQPYRPAPRPRVARDDALRPRRSSGEAPTALWALSAAETGRRLAARDVSALEVVDAVLARLERLEGRLNAFITVTAEAARAAARQADAEIVRGEGRGPLHGVPVSVKDLFFTAGVRTTGGSKLMADWVPDHDAALVERLHAAGAVMIGKTNLDEFGHGAAAFEQATPWSARRPPID